MFQCNYVAIIISMSTNELYLYEMSEKADLIPDNN